MIISIFILNAENNFLKEPVIAEPTQFIRIVQKDGSKQFVPGPAIVWGDPTEHHEITLYNGLKINSNEAVVVYQLKDSL